MWAAYVVTAVIVVGYGLSLWRRAMKGNQAIRGSGDPK